MTDLSEDERQQEIQRIGAECASQEERVLFKALTDPDPEIRAEALLAQIGEKALYDELDRNIARAKQWFTEHGDGEEPPPFMSERHRALLKAGFGQDYSYRFRGRLKEEDSRADFHRSLL